LRSDTNCIRASGLTQLGTALSGGDNRRQLGRLRTSASHEQQREQKRPRPNQAPSHGQGGYFALILRGHARAKTSKRGRERQPDLSFN
jgi:hypothetical protein